MNKQTTTIIYHNLPRPPLKATPPPAKGFSIMRWTEFPSQLIVQHRKAKAKK